MTLCDVYRTEPVERDPTRALRRYRSDVAATPEHLLLTTLIRILGGDAQEVADPAERAPVTVWRIHEGTSLLHEGSPAEFVYVLRTGSMKRVRILEDGYAQVLSFAQPGELLGFDALHNGRQPNAVVALEDATVCAFALPQLRAMRRQWPALDQALQMALSRQLVRAAGTAEMMAAVASDARLARFLLWMSQRMAEAGRSPRCLLLRMGRSDIASLLGVAHATVSRSFTLLADLELISVDNRDVEILDMDGLRRRARYTRRPSEEPSGAARPTAADWTATGSPAWLPGTAGWTSEHRAPGTRNPPVHDPAARVQDTGHA